MQTEMIWFVLGYITPDPRRVPHGRLHIARISCTWSTLTNHTTIFKSTSSMVSKHLLYIPPESLCSVGLCMYVFQLKIFYANVK